MHKRKTNDAELLKLIDEGKLTRKEIAAHFGCSEPAISKRLYVLRPDGEPLKIEALTERQKSFVVEMASGTSQTGAALKAFDISSYDSAKSIGHTLMKDPDIKAALQEIIDREIPLSHLISRLRNMLIVLILAQVSVPYTWAYSYTTHILPSRKST